MTDNPERRKMRLFPIDFQRHFYILLTGGLIGYLVLQSVAITVLPVTFAEGHNLQTAILIDDGYAPYKDIFTLENPLFIWLIGSVKQIFISPFGLKWFFLLFGVLLLFNISIIARYWLGEKIALSSLFLLATATTFLTNTPAVLSVIPALSIATLSLVCTISFLKTGKLLWQLLAGILYGIALWFSTAALSIIVVSVLFIIFSNKIDSKKRVETLSLQTVLKALGIGAIGLFIALGCGLILATPDIVFDHLFVSHLIINKNLSLELKDNIVVIGFSLTYNSGLSIFAVAAVSDFYRVKNHPQWLMIFWFLINMGWLLLQKTLQLEMVDILLPPMAILAGSGLIFLFDKMKNNLSKLTLLLQMGAGIILTVVYFLAIWMRINTVVLRDIDNQSYFEQLMNREAAAQFIQQYTDSKACVIVDDPALAVAAKRLPPPALVGLTEQRISGKLISESEIISAVERNDCQAVVFSFRKYTRPISGLQDWAETHYPNQEK
ncbi:MAG TPA: hypothetical protein G4N96_10085, partial [Chloroflexi bacterium]|nr:hypothetical protein [Chloroflexota bacterium]